MDKINKERQNELERDYDSRFIAEQYTSEGYFYHFHRNVELYGVVHGIVAVTIAGETRVLTDGQIAVIDCLESHSYEIEGQADIFYFHIGTQYLREFRALYPQSRLPHWLMDEEYNELLMERIRPVIGGDDKPPGEIMELARHGIAYTLMADIIVHYGVERLGHPVIGESDQVAEMIQYIYEHYKEPLTLEVLSKVFFLSPKQISKKLSRWLNVDLRAFINDIRVQQVVQMADDPRHKDKTLDELIYMNGFTNQQTFWRSYNRTFRFHRLNR